MISPKREFCIIDVETTGLFPGPKGKDKIIEFAAIRTNLEGETLGKYSTLINPCRDIGPTHIHGIRSKDVKNAPTFEEISGNIINFISDSIIVGHNVNFDLRFLRWEFLCLNFELPEFPRLCTMSLSKKVEPNLPSRKLADICNYFNIPVNRAHTAIEDAEATKELMSLCYKLLFNKNPKASLAEIGVRGGKLKKVSAKNLPVNGAPLQRDKSLDKSEEKNSLISKMISKLPTEIVREENPDIDEYLLLIDRVLEDRIITEEEIEQLNIFAEHLGLTRDQAIAANYEYMRHMIRLALADNEGAPFLVEGGWRLL